jgi:hypothetical protein
LARAARGFSSAIATPSSGCWPSPPGRTLVVALSKPRGPKLIIARILKLRRLTTGKPQIAWQLGVFHRMASLRL